MNFIKFLDNFGVISYQYKNIPYKKSGFTPYIFTHDEIERFFIVCDQMVDFKRPVTEFSYTTPALFRLLYGTGLRISEALHLETQDVHLDKKYLVLHNTKNRVDRMIPFSESVGNALQQYSIYKQSIFPQNLKYFFAKPENTPWSTSRAYVYFRTILLRANIPHNANGPRLHDFRHTFSVHSLAEMASQGLDLYYGLPILSKYLGHTSLGSHRALCTVNC